MAGAEGEDLEGLVLWDPVINGRTYLEELIAFHQEWLRLFLSMKLQDHPSSARLTELVGFPLTHSLRTALENISLLAMQQKPAPNILVVESREEACAGPLREHLQRLGAHLVYQHLATPPIWRELYCKPLVPHRLLQSIVSWMAEVFP
jgi:hypothetical protein